MSSYWRGDLRTLLSLPEWARLELMEHIRVRRHKQTRLTSVWNVLLSDEEEQITTPWQPSFKAVISCWRTPMVRLWADAANPHDEVVNKAFSSPPTAARPPTQRPQPGLAEHLSASHTSPLDSNNSNEVAEAYEEVHAAIASLSDIGPIHIFPPAFHAQGKTMMQRSAHYIRVLHTWHQVVDFIRNIFPMGEFEGLDPGALPPYLSDPLSFNPRVAREGYATYNESVRHYYRRTFREFE